MIPIPPFTQVLQSRFQSGFKSELTGIDPGCNPGVIIRLMITPESTW